MRRIKEKYGVVCLLDALGVSTYDIHQCSEFVREIEEIIKFVYHTKKTYIDLSNKDFTETIIPPVTLTFSDNIVFYWEIKNDNADSRLSCFMVAEYIRSLIAYSLCRGFLFRGAVSLGTFIHHKNTIIGPAVSDAASWFEQADWFGVLATPSYSFDMNLIMDSSARVREGQLPSEYWIEYAIPLKNDKSKKLWALSWPFEFNAKHGNYAIDYYNESIRKLILKRGHIPKNVENKYFNSSAFFKYYTESIFQKIKEPITKSIFDIHDPIDHS